MSAVLTAAAGSPVVERSRRRLARRLAALQGRPRRHGLAGHRARLPAADRCCRPPASWPATGSSEVGVPNAPPTFLGPRAGRGRRRDRGAQGAERRPVRHRPAGAALQGVGRARGAVQDHRDRARPRRCRSAATASAATCCPRPSRAPRSRSSSACWRPLVATADRHPARRLRRLLRRQGRRLPGVALQRLRPRSPTSC